MQDMEVVLLNGGCMPQKDRWEDAGFDLFLPLNGNVKMSGSRNHLVVPLRIKMKIPSGFYGLISNRSSISRNFHITVGAGVIDSGFTGEWFLDLYYNRFETIELKEGEKIAQVIFMEYHNFKLIQNEEFSNSIITPEAYKTNQRAAAACGSTNFCQICGTKKAVASKNGKVLYSCPKCSFDDKKESDSCCPNCGSPLDFNNGIKCTDEDCAFVV